MYPDSESRRRLVEATHAELSLAPTVTNSGALERVRLRARAEGAGGNAIAVTFSADALTDAGELFEVGSSVHVKFAGDSSVVDDLANLLAASSLVELIGTWNLGDVLATGDDEFGPTNLAGGRDATTTTCAFWGPHYPDGPDEDSIGRVVDPLPTIPVGSVTFALLLEEGFELTWTWVSDVIKRYAGTEQRVGVIDYPQQVFRGAAFLIGDDSLAVRSAIQRYAAQGTAFLLGLPHEELTIVGDAIGQFVPVSSTALSDWAVPGTHVLIKTLDDFSQHVIQSVTSDSIEVDGTVDGTICRYGANIMPAVPVFLDAQQGFARYSTPEGIERWQINATAATMWFETLPAAATLALFPLGISGALEGVTLIARVPGADGNNITISFVEGPYSPHPVIVSEDTTALVIGFNGGSPGGTTNTAIATLIATQSLLVDVLTGPDQPGDAVAAGDDEFGPTNLVGGSDGAFGEMGRGAVLATHSDGTPIFDRGVDVDGTAGDSSHAMTDVVRLGAEPFSVGGADSPDWGRQVAISRGAPAEWQWFKKFLGHARGSAASWWLSTFRNDLLATDVGPRPPPPLSGLNDALITIDAGVGDFELWYPASRQHLAIELSTQTYYCKIKSYSDQGDGTFLVRVTGDAPPPAAEEIIAISWLERCRYDRSEFRIPWKGAVFSSNELARAVRQ